MNIQFSGTYQRAPLSSGHHNTSRIADSTQLFIAEMDEAAAALADKIRNEVPDQFQISYNPGDNPNAVVIKEKTSTGVHFISEKDTNGKEIETWVSLDRNESARQFLDRAIAYSKDLVKPLTAGRAQRQQAQQASASLSGWLAPEVNVYQSVALSRGVHVANQLKATLQQLAPSLKQLPAGTALVVESTYDNQLLKVSVVKKDETGKTTDFLPAMGQFSDENEVTQKHRPLSPFNFAESSLFSRLNRLETTKSLLNRGIALAHTLAKREKEVAEYKIAYQGALADSHKNFEIEDSAIIGIHGLSHALTLVKALKNASESLHRVSPDLQLSYLVDRHNGGKESLVIEIKNPEHNTFYPIFLLDKDSEKSYISRKLGESLEKFVNRTVGLAAEYLPEKQRREGLRNKIKPETDAGLNIS